MKRVVLFMFVALLAISVTTAFAGDGCSKEAKKACSKACASKAKGDGEAKTSDAGVKKDAHAGCASSAKQAVVKTDVSVKDAHAGCAKTANADAGAKDTKSACAKACASKAKGDGEAKADAGAKDAHAGCAHSAKQASVKGDAKAHVCPDVKERTALNEFHTAMHPMHVAVGDGDFAAVRTAMPTLMATTEAVNAYNCDGYDKCSDACRTNFDGQKTALLDAVKGLAKVCKGDDDEKITSSFGTMHEAYITFANTCVKPEKTDVEAKEKKETY